ncbi:MAG: coproporphyrinogen III oxidase family protein, partial [Desulfobulbus sp.]|nr:coproporphyrinogen III oxidase family protein [Desulfobulbus sp.]
IAARQAGFDNLSFDLMYGLPRQTAASWRKTLDLALNFQPKHLSMYELTLEEGTPIARQAQADSRFLPPEEEVLTMMAVTEAAIAGTALQRYEISNYAEPGYQCRHNVNYWHNGFYVGLGPGAVSAFNGARRTAVTDLDRFCRCTALDLPVWEDVERLDREAAFRETVVVGLRLLRGVSVTVLINRFGLDPVTYYGPVLDRLVEQGLVQFQQDRLCLTSKGLPVANRVMVELV